MREIGDFISGIIGLFFIGAILYGVFSSGDSTVITVVVIILIVFFIIISRDDKPKSIVSSNSTAPKQIAKKETYNDDYDGFDDKCSPCGGLGWEYYCTTCLTQAVLSPSTEKYDGDMYCPRCSRDGKDSDNIKEDLCSVCNGTRKDPNPIYYE